MKPGRWNDCCKPCRGTGLKDGLVLTTCPPQYIPCPECQGPRRSTQAMTAFEDYVGLLVQLHRAMRLGGSGDSVRDLMDIHWRLMSEEERVASSQISELMYKAAGK